MIHKFEELQHHMNDFLNDKLSGKDMVKKIDDFVSDDYVYDLSEGMSQKLLDLQDEVALYVSDPKSRKEYVDYFGDDVLRGHILKFLEAVGVADLSSSD